MNKKVPLWILLLIIWCSFVSIIMFGWDVWRIKSLRLGPQTTVDKFVIAIAAYPAFVVRSFDELDSSSRLISPDFFPGIKGFKAENNYVDSNYVLLATYSKKYDQSVARLIRLSDQKVVYQWVPNYPHIIQQLSAGNKDWNVRDPKSLMLYHPAILPDGSIIFNTLLSPLFKIDKNSRLVWAVNGVFHHTTEVDADGNIWAPSTIKASPLLSTILNDFHDDAITKISSSGKILYQRSVARILIDNGYRGLLLGAGALERDALHLNAVRSAPFAGRYWQKGDLVISLRNKSTVFLYRPSTNKILWLQTGPWICQHDARFVDSARISIFGNNTVRLHGDEKLLEGINQVFVVDFRTGKTDTPYTKLLKLAGVATINEGLARVLENGDLFIEETNRNRLLRGNNKGIEWQLVERIDNHSLAALSCSDFLTKAEFNRLTFLKNN